MVKKTMTEEKEREKEKWWKENKEEKITKGVKCEQQWA